MSSRNRSKESKSDEDIFVTPCQLQEALLSQKEHFTDLLQQQQNNFRDFIKIIMENSNKRIDELTRENHDLKISLQFTQKEVDSLKADNAKLSADLKSIESEKSNLSESLLSSVNRTDYLEGQSRRNNLIFEGLQESSNETWAESEDKVRKLLVGKLELGQQDAIEMERAHRTGKPDSNGKPRPVVVKFLRFKDKQAVLSKAKLLKGTNFFINEDYTEAVRQKRRELLPAMRAARARGDIAYLRHDRLIVHPPNNQLKTGR